MLYQEITSSRRMTDFLAFAAFLVVVLLIMGLAGLFLPHSEVSRDRPTRSETQAFPQPTPEEMIPLLHPNIGLTAQ